MNQLLCFVQAAMSWVKGSSKGKGKGKKGKFDKGKDSSTWIIAERYETEVMQFQFSFLNPVARRREL